MKTGVDWPAIFLQSTALFVFAKAMCQPQESAEMGVEDQVPLMSMAEQPLMP